MLAEEVSGEVNRSEFECLHYIVPTGNLPSVVRHGLLSHNRASTRRHLSVAMAAVQDIRDGKRVHKGLKLHDYVNLYLNARNCMLYYVYRIQRHSVCVLRVSTNAFDIPDSVIADCNAATMWARFSPSPSGLTKLNSEDVFRRDWNHPDEFVKQEMKRKLCAELLVPYSIPPEYLLGVSVPTTAAASELAAMAGNLPVTVDEDLFFLRGR